jgi:hypothetical protein
MLKMILRGDIDPTFIKLFTGANWILMVVMVAIAGLVSTPQMAAGVLLGGLIANLNCVGLDRDCQRMLRWRHMGAYYGGMAVRMGLIALAVTVAFLFFPGIFSPVGLFIGLSVAVVNFNILTLAMVIYRARFKEAT